MTITPTGSAAPTKKPAQRDCGCDDSCDPPRALERNAFFPRKLMEVKNWKAEQRFHRSARELVTRLATGSGVLCGLEVMLTDEGTLVITSGVATDGRGRVIVVPYDVEIDPGRLTDCHGRALIDAAAEGPVTVSLCYRECGIDLVAVPNDGCDDDPECIPSMIREAFAVTVTAGATERVGLPDGVCEALHTGRTDDTPEGETDDRRLLLDRLDPRDCGCAEDCVPLAVVTIEAKKATGIDTAVRTVIRSNRELLDLILCLADHLDDCCGGEPTPTALPPRVTALWPLQGEEDWKEFLGTGRIEIAFDRAMAVQGFQSPNDWLGVWLIGARGVQRLALEWTTGSLEHIAAPLGGDGAAFRAKIPGRATQAIVLVMARSTVTGIIRANESDKLALDPDLLATALTEKQRDELWKVAPGATSMSLGSLIANAASVPSPALPSGDGTAGGDLHVVLAPPSKTPPPPRLLSVWPDGGVYYNQDNPDEYETWKQYGEQPRISITVSKALDPGQVANPHEWIRVWHGSRDFMSVYSLAEVALEAGAREDLADGTVRYTFPFRDFKWIGNPDEVIVQLRADAAPVGDDDRFVLDADFPGTSLTNQPLKDLWEGFLYPDGLALAQHPTRGEALYDTSAGGLAHWAFTSTESR